MKKLKVIPLLLLVFPLTIYCLTIPISFDETYCSGEKWIDIRNVSKPDTVLFSTGLSINIVSFSCGNLEIGYLWKNLIFNDKTFNKAGYKSNEEISRKPYSCNSLQTIHTTQLFGNSDTIWNNALQFPDSLVFLDSIKTYKVHDTSSFVGKWCFKNWEDVVQGCYWFTLENNSNAIIYVHCLDNRKMKLLIDNFITENMAPSQNQLCGSQNPWIDSILIRWAADSMGNGVFKESPVKTINPPSVNSNTFPYRQFIVTTKMHVEFNLLAQGSGIESLQVFSLTGQRMAQWQNPGKHSIWKTQGITSGVYLANVVFGNKKIGSYKFVVKK